MPLRVAPCPRCKSPLVFGERGCRSCGQTFDYGTPAPPEPSFAEIVEALSALGLPVPAPAPRAAVSTPVMPGLDTGRFADAGEVHSEEIPGLVDSDLFRSFTPKVVHVDTVAGLDTGRFQAVGAVAPTFTPGLEVTTDNSGDVFVEPVSGLFHSDIFRTSGDLVTQPVEGFEPTPGADRGPTGQGSPDARRAGARKGVKDADLGRITCRCGEIHRLPRCPACGTPHPDRA